MSKAVKQAIMRDYTGRFAGDHGPTDAMVISIRGVKGVDTTRLRATLAKKNIKITVLRNSLARKVLDATPLKPLAEFVDGSSALAYGGQSVIEIAREIVGAMAKMPAIELKGAVLDGIVFKGKDGVTELSKFPTREEAQADVLTLVVSPGRKLVGQIQGPGRSVAGLIRAIEERLEKGEAIAKKAG